MGIQAGRKQQENEHPLALSLPAGFHPRNRAITKRVTILVLGFGAFGTFTHNPSAALALGLNGLRSGNATIVGLEMPVSYRRSAALTAARANEYNPAFILGIGVAANRKVALIEEQAVNRVMPGRADVDGRVPHGLGDGPDVVQSADAWVLAQALGIGLSPDAGRYVCNAWLYQSIRSGQRTGFLHVPPDGFDILRLSAGLGRFAEVLARGTAGWHSG